MKLPYFHRWHAVLASADPLPGDAYIPPMARTAVITGASSGIGAAAARALAADGYRTVLGARRFDRLAALAAEIGGEAVALDVTDEVSIAEFTGFVPGCDVLVHCAGGAIGLDRVADDDEGRWRWMYEANTLGMARVTRALLPRLIASGDGHVVGVTSIAAFETYRGGAGRAHPADRSRAGDGRNRVLPCPFRGGTRRRRQRSTPG